MEPEQSQKSTKKSVEGLRKRLTKREAVQESTLPSVACQESTAASEQGTSSSASISQQHFSTTLKTPREGAQKKVRRPRQPKCSSFEHLHHASKQRPVSPAFVSPGKLEYSLEGPAWQLVDPVQPGPSQPFTSSGLHARGQLIPSQPSIIPREDLPSVQKVFVHRPSQVSLKHSDEVHKKEKKPQKPGKYICQYCSRPCAKPSVLQKHIRSHTGERPYPCIPCGFSFKTKSNLYKHRKSHAHRIKAGLASGVGSEMYTSSLDLERIGGEEFEEPTEGESTDSEEETGVASSHLVDVSPRQKHSLSSSSIYGMESQGASHEFYSSSHSSVSQPPEDSSQFAEPSSDHPSQKSENMHTIKQKLALRLSERKKVIDEQTFLSPGSKGSTESGYFSRSESAEQQISPPNTNAKSYAEIIFGKCGRIGQRTAVLAPTTTQGLQQGSTEEKPSTVPLSMPRTQVIEHITKLITINEAVVDTSEIDSVKPRRSSLSRRSSIESPKSSVYRDPFQLDIKSSGSSSQLETSKLLLSRGEKTKPEQSFLSLQQSHSATETAPLLRSHSMPSATCTTSSPHTFRVSYSFDDRVMEPDVLSRSQVFSSHPRMLRRQPAIELPMGMEYTTEEAGSISKDAVCKLGEEHESKESDSSKKPRKGLKVKGLVFECNICGAKYKKRDNYEAHKKYYCSELQMLKSPSTGSHTPSETGKALAEHDTWSQTMHYKLGPSLELAPLRKRRKEKSLGDDEDPPMFNMPESSSSQVSQFTKPASSDTALNLARDTSKSPADTSEAKPLSDVSEGYHYRTSSQGSSMESLEKRTTSKEISVIQHTSSFEKSESMEQLSGDGDDKPTCQESLQPPIEKARPSHSLQPKLVRQPNIQVPEILVTEEPDRPENEPEPIHKEQEKEEFQWPQRSQTLAQLPAEKLPPKKKRLRLAEMTQSSGESSFESITLTRSPSQESSVSHASSHSMSFEREEPSKSETADPSSESKPVGSHMLTVPSHHHHTREMRRSASEQTPNLSHASQISENRSKSFDYGSLSSSSTSSCPAVSSTVKERRKCFLVRQASLSRHPEHDPDIMPKGWQKLEEQSTSSSKTSVKSKNVSHSSSSQGEQSGDKCELKDSPKSVYSLPLTEALQVFHPPMPPLTLQEKTYLPPELSLFPIQHILQQSGHASDLFSTSGVSDILSVQFPIPQIPPSLFQAPQLPLQQSLLHPSPLQIAHQLMSHPTEIPFRQHPSFLPVHYLGSSPISSAFFLPLQSQFALPLPTEVSGHFHQSKTMPSAQVGSSSPPSCKEYSGDGRLHPLPLSTCPSASEAASQLVVSEQSDPVVSLVVPVRIQTHMPSYGSAMYTTVSQILDTQSDCSSSLVLHKLDDIQTKGVRAINFSLAQMITDEPKSLFQAPFLRVPLPATEIRGCMALSSSCESMLGLDGGPSTAGGSKRMLSPAGSLELTMETQQQKRVKEEVVCEADDKLELLQPPSTEEGKRPDKAQFITPGPCRVEGEVPPTLAPKLSSPKEIASPLQPVLPHVGSPQSKTLDKYQQQAGTLYGSMSCAQQVKQEDCKELSDQPPYNPPSTASLSTVSQSAREGADKKVPQFPRLHTTTNVSWCYLNYIKPNHIQQVDQRASVYASWCISLYNPNLPGIPTKAALSLLRSKQKLSKEIYTTATAPHLETDRLVPSSPRKPRMTEIHLPTAHSSESQKEPNRAESEEGKRGKHEEEPSVSKRVEPARIRIFEGGYKSNEEYVYVRGRGRGKYVCEECGIRCKKPSMLKKHIRTHTDVRPYVCKYCNFAFKTKGNLTKHMKSKAHSKKCQEMGVTVSSLLDLEGEEGASEDRFQDLEGRDGSEVVEEHQFSDLEESDEDDDNDDDEEEEEVESQEELSLKPLQIKPICLQLPSSCPSSIQEESTGASSFLVQDIVSSCQQSPRGHLAASSRLEAKLSEDKHEDSSSLSSSASHRPILTSGEHLTSTEKESVTRSQVLLAIDLSRSKDASPRRQWSPGHESDQARAVLYRKHLLTKNETSPKRLSSTGDISSLRCPSPVRGKSPGQYMSPEREVSPLRCVSPRLEMSPSRHLSPRTDLSPRAYHSPERGVSPLRHLSPSRETSSVGYLSLKKRLPPGGSASSPRYPSPGQEEMPCSSKSVVDMKAPVSLKAQHGMLFSKPISPRPHGKSTEIYKSKLKVEPWSTYEISACSPGIMHPICSRPLRAVHELHGHPPSRVEENVFSHLPLHSQQLTRTLYPMIPIGGIQMVQTRPITHPSLVPSSVVPLQAGYSFASSMPTAFSQTGGSGKEQQAQQDIAISVFPAAKLSKLSHLAQTKSSSFVKEKSRTSELQLKTEEEEYRVTQFAEASHLEHEGCPAGTDSPGTERECSPKPSISREEPSTKTGKKQCGSSSTSYDWPRTFISDFPAQTLDRSSSTGCLSEPPLSHSHSHRFSTRRRNLSGEPSHHRKHILHLEGARLGHPQRSEGKDKGST
ncbi:transcription factor HIVEP3 [Rhinatrema bivittatum]|uniref:transcription factor HIVEP3 n=1 Tax=Rhinatrema bivittatum TaxID=194408 RepID=UPI00112E4195|nr:transcription factor HIVEP3 [Rhinatrema bivittatum]XP_029475466.1 transcription factor HIVEP3 [Rhinatrema bivittatum]XP_029475467.1 transcription factor HIVEP3 [Rhinatrema bivittatum]XP_029475468.1 transcription factor HIVEP3 [Rhinatrema bivittatum]XP_029475469.1 transcription factor HIVEP3 [Rhinatrema bivittatum]XP_029475470.1 transcription factor HIVEP3 [Rhinatrema bivittatum]